MNTMGALFNYPKFKAFDSNGLELIGGKLYSYEPGTVIPKATYQDEACTIPNTNPVVLDANGEAVVYFDGTYDIALYDSDDTLVWTMSGLSGMGGSTSSSGYEYDVLMTYGSGTDYTDTSIAAAIAAIGTANATLLLRPGTWVISNNISFPSNIKVKLPPGALLSIATGKAVTFNQPPEIGYYQVFSGLGTAAFSADAIGEINALWWGDYTEAAITAAISSIGANTADLYLAPGLWTISNGFTVPSNINLVVPNGVAFTVASGKTVTINGTVSAGGYQWIYGTGTVTVNTAPRDLVWWGLTECLEVDALKVAGNAVVGEGASGGLAYSFAATVASGALTIALKDADGNDPDAAGKISFQFRSVTATDTKPVNVPVVAPTSIVLSNGSTLGFTNSETGRIYIWAINNAGTVVLGLSRRADVFNEARLCSTSAEGGTGGADSDVVMYTDTSLSSKAIKCLGYIDITTGATAGDWTAPPLLSQIMLPGVKRTGEVVQIANLTDSALTAITAVEVKTDVTLTTTNTQLWNSLAITPVSYANKLEVEVIVNMAGLNSKLFSLGLFQSNAVVPATAVAASYGGLFYYLGGDLGANYITNNIKLFFSVIAKSTSEVTFSARIAGATDVNGNGRGSRILGGCLASTICIKEIAA
jgi:hypothetical protein